MAPPQTKTRTRPDPARILPGGDKKVPAFRIPAGAASPGFLEPGWPAAADRHMKTGASCMHSSFFFWAHCIEIWTLQDPWYRIRNAVKGSFFQFPATAFIVHIPVCPSSPFPLCCTRQSGTGQTRSWLSIFRTVAGQGCRLFCHPHPMPFRSPLHRVCAVSFPPAVPFLLQRQGGKGRYGDFLKGVRFLPPHILKDTQALAPCEGLPAQGRWAFFAVKAAKRKGSRLADRRKKTAHTVFLRLPGSLPQADRKACFNQDYKYLPRCGTQNTEGSTKNILLFQGDTTHE